MLFSHSHLTPVERKLSHLLARDGLTLGAPCGKGSFAVVYKVYKGNDLFGVVKIGLLENIPINLETLVFDNMHAFTKENTAMRSLRDCANVPKLLNELKEFEVHGKHYGFFIMEGLVPLSVLDDQILEWAKTYGTDAVISIFMLGILTALLKARSVFHDFSHRDIKPMNIFVRLTNDLTPSIDTFVLGDFGIGNLSQDAATFEVLARNRRDPFCYPETDDPVTIESDVYSLGRVISLFFVKMFKKNNLTVSDELEAFVRRMCAAKKRDRPSLSQCYEFFKTTLEKYSNQAQKAMAADKTASKEALQILNSGTNKPIPASKNKTKAMRYEGIRCYIQHDIHGAVANFSKAGDLASQYYLAALDARQGKPERALALKERMPVTHPLYDPLLALLSGMRQPLTALEKASAETVLTKDADKFFFL